MRAMMSIYRRPVIPAGATRGGHSHIEQHELVFAVSGSFEVSIDDGCNTKGVLVGKLVGIGWCYKELHQVNTGWVFTEARCLGIHIECVCVIVGVHTAIAINRNTNGAVVGEHMVEP